MLKSSFVQKTAAYVMIELLGLALVFHLLVLSGIIDYRIVWGGRLSTTGEMIVFEAVSILSNAVFLLIVLRKIGRLKFIPNEKVINGVLWAMAVVFLLNTAGNLLSLNEWERNIFSPLTFVLTVCCVILALRK
jgi:hypothetical protein